MAWIKRENKMGVWGKSSNPSDNWAIKTNKLGTWISHQINIVNSALFKHRLLFGTYILGTLVYNGQKQNWLKDIQISSNWTKKLNTTDTWDKKSQTSETWADKTPDTKSWSKHSDKVNSWTKK